MKKVLYLYFLPLLLSFVFLYLLVRKTPFEVSPTHCVLDSLSAYTPYLDGNPYLEKKFLNFGDNDQLHILGSSELAARTYASPDVFFPNNFAINTVAVGEAGNQSFSIYSQLLTNKKDLGEAKIVVIVSPTWFMKSYASGVRASIYKRYNSERMLSSIVSMEGDNFKNYAYRRIAEIFDQYPGRNNVAIDVIRNSYAVADTTVGVFQRLFINKPLLSLDQLVLNSQKRKDTVSEMKIKRSSLRVKQGVSWDSLKLISKKAVNSRVTNNLWGINDDYYNTYIKGKTNLIEIVAINENNELEDLTMIIKLLKSTKANAAFVISPMNPFYYTNIDTLSSTILEIESRIGVAGFPCLNLWNTDTSSNSKEVLMDVMHFSEHGWLRVNEFIFNTYYRKQ